MTVSTLGLVIGWILTGFIGLLAVMILLKIWKGDIDLNYLISDENGWASLSRFQFLPGRRPAQRVKRQVVGLNTPCPSGLFTFHPRMASTRNRGPPPRSSSFFTRGRRL